LIPVTLTSQGDFNKDGLVNSADYVVWRKTMGQTGSNLDADGNGNWQVDQGDLVTWRVHFGTSVSGSSGATGSASATVPEPATPVVSFFAAAAVLVGVRWRLAM
jgi:hypothetical protein